MNDTTRRFLHAIIERLPAGEIVELQLFPAIRSGATESGAAVIALEPAVIVPEPESILDPPPNDAGEPLGDEESAEEGEEPAMVQGTLALETDVPHHTDVTPEADVAHDSVIASDDAPPRVEARASGTRPTPGSIDATGAIDDDVADGDRETLLSVTIDDARPTSTVDASLDAGHESDDDSPYRDDPPPDAEVAVPYAAGAADLVDAGAPNEPEETMALGDLLSLPAPGGEVPDPLDDGESPAARDEPPTIKRYAILSARYRLTLKGPDRGKWELELKHEADAPLDTVQRVARGVARRAGDESDPEHFSGESLRLALEAPVWATSP